MGDNGIFILGIYISNKILIISLILILILILSLFKRFRRNKKKKADENIVVRPITDVIGSDQEQLEELNKDLKLFGFAYDPSQDIFYSLNECWQRKFGYFRLYDKASATLSMIIDCRTNSF